MLVRFKLLEEIGGDTWLDWETVGKPKQYHNGGQEMVGYQADH